MHFSSIEFDDEKKDDSYDDDDEEEEDDNDYDEDGECLTQVNCLPL